MTEHEFLGQLDTWLHAPAMPVPRQLGADAHTPLVSSAILVGSKAGLALANAKALKAATDDEAKFNIFKNDYACACSTILDIARQKAGYNPTKPDDPKGKEKFLDYLNRVQKAPFFTLTYAERETIKSESRNYDELINAIADTFQGLVEENKKAVVSALSGLAKVAANSESTKQTKDLFVQNVISASNQYSVYLYTCHVDMESATKKGVKEKQSLFEVSTTKLDFKKSLWPTAARKVYDITVLAIDDWLDDNTTVAESNNFKLCLTERA
jgi:hypothetical protein